jgi:hypothetical protein
MAPSSRISEWPYVYQYYPGTLWVSYGLAMVLSLVAAVAGIIVILRSGVSYSNRFSTVPRTTRGEHLDQLVGAEDRQGNEPLSKHIARATIRIGTTDVLDAPSSELRQRRESAGKEPSVSLDSLLETQ